MTQRMWSRRDFFRRSASAGAVLLGGTAALSACTQVSPSGGAAGGGGTLERARQAGTITIGISNEAPYGFVDQQGKTTGEGVEVAKAILAKLGIADTKAVTVEFGELISGLTLSKQYDMVTAGMFITGERCRAAMFSVPDYTAPTAFLVPRGNPKGVTKFEDIRDKDLKVAVLSGAVEQGYAADTGIPEGQIQVLGDQNSLLQAVTSNRADCAALTNISLNDVVKKNSEAPVEVTAGFFPVIKGKELISAGAFVFRKGEDELVNAFNKELVAMQKSGEWLKIAGPFGFSQENVPGPDVTTEKLCAA